MVNSPWYTTNSTPNPGYFALDLGPGTAIFVLERQYEPKTAWKLYLVGRTGKNSLLAEFSAASAEEAQARGGTHILTFLHEETRKIAQALCKDTNEPSVWDRLLVEGEGLHTGKVVPKVFDFPPPGPIAVLPVK